MRPPQAKMAQRFHAAVGVPAVATRLNGTILASTFSFHHCTLQRSHARTWRLASKTTNAPATDARALFSVHLYQPLVSHSFGPWVCTVFGEGFHPMPGTGNRHVPRIAACDQKSELLSATQNWGSCVCVLIITGLLLWGLYSSSFFL